jgi:arylsulfatase A
MRSLKLMVCAMFFLPMLYSCKTEVKQPNIVVLLCDDLGYGDLSSYGHPVIQTPNLDEMAAKGIRLTDCYSAAPVCSPSRAGLLTGRSPNKAGVYDFIPGLKKSEDCRDMVHLQAKEKTIPALLKSVGYTTCLSGKWHCSSRFNSPEQPQPDYFGFDHWFSTHNNAAPSHENPNNFVRDGQKVGEIKGFSCQIVVDEALTWLQKIGKKKPFYLQVCFHEPHEPIASPSEMVAKYRPFSQSDNEAEYYANVANMDSAVGRLMDYLEANYSENTLVIFTSDNGPETLNRYPRAQHSYGSPGPLKGMKLWTNEAGFRVPGIIYWIGQPTFKGTSNTVVSSLDFLPTFCDMAGAELPNRTLDGQSILPFIKEGVMQRKKPLIWIFYNALNDRVVAMRDGDWKMMATLKNDTTMLPDINNVYDGNEALIKQATLDDFVMYNLKEDVAESEDVSTRNPEVFEKMKLKLKSEYKSLVDSSFVWHRE